MDIQCFEGDITDQKDMTAVVNAANAHLKPGGGVAGAIHRGAGPKLYQECKPLAPIEPGEAVITGAYNLPNEYVIHCLGPVYGRDKPEEKLLVDCYRNALLLAEKHGIDSIAFPSISTGAFGYPVEEAAKVALKTVQVTLMELKNVKTVRFVLHSQRDLEIHERVLTELLNL